MLHSCFWCFLGVVFFWSSVCSAAGVSLQWDLFVQQLPPNAQATQVILRRCVQDPLHTGVCTTPMQEITRVVITDTAFVDASPLVPDTTYCYDALSTDGTMQSLSSNVVCVKMGAALLVPGTPDKVLLTASPDGLSFTLTWRYNSTIPATKFVVQNCIVLGRSCSMSTMGDRGVDASLSSRVVTLNAGTVKCFQVKGVNTVGQGTPSTPRCGVILPTGFSLTTFH